MKFQAVLFVSFLPSVLGWWNCRIPKGGDLGTCLWDGDLKTELTCGQVKLSLLLLDMILTIFVRFERVKLLICLCNRATRARHLATDVFLSVRELRTARRQTEGVHFWIRNYLRSKRCCWILHVVLDYYGDILEKIPS
ncbi:uncharacterized protein CLUP02_16057 [Colletotrichum lupini]|uniref:Secreted protein n=1 Tax=Colletotrichum lupini TaxID=145971 RepID=A0A9Q8T976_9PEZI|nr:uncharacterized protein CLUP02_16057 [Colletotrichum lupini]UQC90527.1 hypothetical protein CLUP02_16057 [Colletotrichum lupini]